MKNELSIDIEEYSMEEGALQNRSFPGECDSP
jgi:hypothetical protein